MSGGMHASRPMMALATALVALAAVASDRSER